MKNLTLTVGAWDEVEKMWIDTADLLEHGYKPEFKTVGSKVNLIWDCEFVLFDFRLMRTLTEIWLHTDPKYVNVEAVTWKWSDGTTTQTPRFYEPKTTSKLTFDPNTILVGLMTNEKDVYFPNASFYDYSIYW
jgi:hypothetical protein